MPPSSTFVSHDGWVGAGCWVVGPGRNKHVNGRCLGTTDISTVYVAELEGISLALGRATHEEVYRTMPEQYTIFTDNQAKLREIANLGTGPGQYIVRRIIAQLNGLKQTSLTVTFRWIPARMGVQGNEKANIIAKNHASRCAPLMPGPQWYTAGIQRMIKSITETKWKSEWKMAKHRRVTFRLLPEPTRKSLALHSSLTKAQSSVLIQARTSKIALRKYLHDIGRADDPHCEHCLEDGRRASETVRHVMDTCPAYTELRRFFPNGEVDYRGYIPYLRDPQNTANAANYLLSTRRLGQFLSVKPQGPTTEELGAEIESQ